MSGEHNHETSTLDNKLKLGIGLNILFTAFEFAVGILTGSLALISDAGHNLTDCLSLVISFFANKISKKAANDKNTYGYGRATILAALLNGMLLFFLAIYIFREAYERFYTPHPLNGGIIIGVAFLGICLNASIVFLFRNNKDDMNIRSAYLNMIFDAIASAGAMLAGLLIILTGQTFFDPIISVVIGIFLLRSSWSVVKDALHVLLEGVPNGIETEKVKKSILNISDLVKNVDDLHIWALSSRNAALSCHIVIEEKDLDKSMKIVGQIKHELKENFRIDHATIETELTECYTEK